MTTFNKRTERGRGLGEEGGGKEKIKGVLLTRGVESEDGVEPLVQPTSRRGLARRGRAW